MSREIDARRPARLLLLLVLCCLFTAVACSMAFGQDKTGPPPPSATTDGSGMGHTPGAPPFEHHRPPMERAFHVGPRGRWWNDPTFVKLLNLTPDQQKKMEDVFQQSRANLIDLSAEVKKREATMTPLLEADQPDESKVLSQIDQIAQARAELEKANARMLLGLRRVLTQDQWQKLQASDPSRHSFGGDDHRDAGPPMN